MAKMIVNTPTIEENATAECHPPFEESVDAMCRTVKLRGRVTGSERVWFKYTHNKMIIFTLPRVNRQHDIGCKYHMNSYLSNQRVEVCPLRK